MDLHPLEAQRDNLSKALIYESSSPRYIPRAEESRVESLLDETYVDPYANDTRLVKFGRNVLTKVGLHTPKTAELVERPYLEADQQVYTERIHDELEYSRENIRNNIFKGVDDVAVDERIGLRKEESILPPLFRELHRKSEKENGHDLTFLEWMSDHATDEQLVNVWQWHDKYLTDLDQNPAFKEQITAVKASYVEGTRIAIQNGLLHPDMAVDGSTLDKIDIIHSSPLSPVYGMANADEKAGLIQMQEGVDDYILHHELTHALNKGLFPSLEEGGAELIATAIYNSTHADQPNDLSRSVYKEQLATLASMERMSGGTANLYELSHAFAGPEDRSNTLKYLTKVQEVVGLPVGVALIVSAQEWTKEALKISGSATAIRVTQRLMQDQTEFMEDMLTDASGSPVRPTLQELVTRILSKDTLAKYNQSIVMGGLEMVKTMHDIDNGAPVTAPENNEIDII